MSHSSIRYVSLKDLEFPKTRAVEPIQAMTPVESVIETLRRSNQSLLYLHLEMRQNSAILRRTSPFWSHGLMISKDDFPNLLDLRLIHTRSDQTRIRINRSLSNMTEGEQAPQVLWHLDFNLLDLNPWTNLGSLSIFAPQSSGEWRKLLKELSQTLRHLRMNVSDHLQPMDLDFPRLQILEFGCSLPWNHPIRFPSFFFPSWIKLPRNSALILDHTRDSFYVDVPSVSELWINVNPGNLYFPGQSCPGLETLRLLKSQPYRFSEVCCLLEQRKSLSGAGVVVKQIRIQPIKKLVMSLKDLTQAQISKLEGLVEEVVDLETASKFMDLEF